jgi:mannose-6-phosphate isomerase class I
MTSNYDKFPYVAISSTGQGCDCGWQQITETIRSAGLTDQSTVCLECYPGVFEDEVEQKLRGAFPEADVIRARDWLKPAAEIRLMLNREITDDPVFGRITSFKLGDFFRPVARKSSQEQMRFVIGTGAGVIEPEWDLLIYADLARWEIQKRQRRGEIGNLGLDNVSAGAAEKYKSGFFIEWRVADRLKKDLLPKIDYLLDTTITKNPRMISGSLFRKSLKTTVTRPFRVQPLFDPGPWGGQWMRRVCDLPDGPANYAWCFDCVPEENSLVFGFGGERVEVPAMDLVLSHPRELLGEAVYARFGAEFPIRFDFLDTMQGGNLSLQVHPLTGYIQQHFGMHYTQDESYYLLDAAEDACVYLGLKEGVDEAAMSRDLHSAQEGGSPFPVEQYVNNWPAKKHDHFLIPAGTIHCSGRNGMVLEISATPYIFTFKLWDWGRLGLDGKPRPIHLEHGISNLQWDRTTDWVKRKLIGRTEFLAEGDGWREERTGLDERQFIETRRHWFTGAVLHDTHGTVNVLNLVEGREAIVDSPQGRFPPMMVHYAETFIVPAAVGEYRVRPTESVSKPLATIKAFVRSNA